MTQTMQTVQTKQTEPNKYTNLVSNNTNMSIDKTHKPKNLLLFNKIKFQKQLDKINNYEECKKKAKLELQMHFHERNKFFFDYLNKIKK